MCKKNSPFNRVLQANTNSISFKDERYGGWFNPQKLTIPGSFEVSFFKLFVFDLCRKRKFQDGGFYVKLRVQHLFGTTVKPIETASWNISEYDVAAQTPQAEQMKSGQITKYALTAFLPFFSGYRISNSWRILS